MERTCARALALGIPAVGFTEHVDYDAWSVSDENLVGHEHLLPYYADGVLTPAPLDVDGYLDCLQRCRDKFPSLRIISGLELGEPHWHEQEARHLIAAGRFELVLGSLHGLRLDGRFVEMAQLLQDQEPTRVIRDYLLEVARLITNCQAFSVLAHIDYPARYGGQHVGSDRFDPTHLEDEYRHVLDLLAASDRALEINTRIKPYPAIVRWWREAGGQAITFGSDAHVPAALATGFSDAAALAEAEGFRPGRDPEDVWHRVRPR